ncbi:MAG: Transcriptional regulator, AraC family, partial [uncultured Actinomycetospora sp.]
APPPRRPGGRRRAAGAGRHRRGRGLRRPGAPVPRVRRARRVLAHALARRGDRERPRRDRTPGGGSRAM